MRKRLYGSYSIISCCNEDDPQEKKIEMIKTGISNVLDTIKKVEEPLELSTMELIVKDGIDMFSPDDTDWFADEKPGYQHPFPKYTITVGIKLRQK